MSDSNRAILVVSIGERTFRNRTLNTMRSYADRIGADLLIEREISIPFTLQLKCKLMRFKRKKIECYLQKMLSLYKALEKFDRVLLLDDSCLVSHTAPDIFEQVPRNQIGAFPESERADFRSYNYDKKFILKKKKININEYYNTGVLLVSKHQREIFSPRNLSKNLELFKSKYPDQAYFSYISAIEKTNVNKLHDEWNFMPVFDYSNDSNRQLTELPNDHLRLVRQKHIIHVTGYYKKRDKIIEQINLALYNDQNVRNSLRPR